MATIKPIITNNYVKFVQGTPTAFANLATKDSNTLYFVREATANSGTLYLGDKLIGGVSQLNDIADIVINDNNLADKQILVYDNATQKWINASITAVISTMTGATATADGVAGLVPVPTKGQQNYFLRGDGKWAEVKVGSLDSFDDSIFEKNTSDELTIKGFASATNGSVLQKQDNDNVIWTSVGDLTSALDTRVASLESKVAAFNGGLKRTIVDSTSDIDITAEDAGSYIYLVKKENGSGTNLYDEYMVIDGALEVISSDNVGNLSGYMTESAAETFFTNKLNTLDNRYVLKTTYVTFTNSVGDLSALTKSGTNSTLVEQVNELTDRLTWYELSEVTE